MFALKRFLSASMIEPRDARAHASQGFGVDPPAVDEASQGFGVDPPTADNASHGVGVDPSAVDISSVEKAGMPGAADIRRAMPSHDIHRPGTTQERLVTSLDKIEAGLAAIILEPTGVAGANRIQLDTATGKLKSLTTAQFDCLPRDLRTFFKQLRKDSNAFHGLHPSTSVGGAYTPPATGRGSQLKGQFPGKGAKGVNPQRNGGNYGCRCAPPPVIGTHVQAESPLILIPMTTLESRLWGAISENPLLGQDSDWVAAMRRASQQRLKAHGFIPRGVVDGGGGDASPTPMTESEA